MDSNLSKSDLIDRLRPFGQQHVLHFWEEIDDAGRAQLAQQLGTIDLARLEDLFRKAGETHDWEALSRRAEPPRALRLADRSNSDGPFGWSTADAFERGQKALKDGEIGVLLIAGGQGSRLGFDRPKGLYPIGPVSGASLLQIHIEKVRAVADRYGKPVPLFLMNSPATQVEQAAFLLEKGRFGLPEDDLFLFCQGTMPAVDKTTGKLLLADKDRLFLSPDGHGGTLAALDASGALKAIRQQGIEHLFYLQVDNPLVPIGDPEFVGHHLLAQSELTSIAVAKQAATDKVGNFVSIDGKTHVIEYSDFPKDVAERTTDTGELAFWAGSIAIHMFAVSFFERLLSETDTLPFHIAHKKVPYLDESGHIVKPTEPNALKFERFIFDLLPQAENALVVEYAEDDCFAPLKNAPGAERDTEQYVQRFMVDQHSRWLREAGVQVVNDAAVEISPLWALDAKDVAKRVQPGMVIDEACYLTINP